MSSRRLALIVMVLLGACGREEEARQSSESPTMETRAPVSATTDATIRSGPAWSLKPGATSTELVLQSRTSARIISFSCPSNERRLQINVPAFTAIGSEDRLSFGTDGEVEALVADIRGDRQRGGVSAEGAVPSNLAILIGGRVSAGYGTQRSGPHPVIPQDMATAFVAACRRGIAKEPAKAEPTSQPVSPCLVQDGRSLEVQALRAVGTEPFWAARIEGRCITYSHPEDQQGTRVWTRYTETPQGGLWSGALGGRRFELRTRAQPACSDGMSDTTYPLAVDLTVLGERRQGCAAPS